MGGINVKNTIVERVLQIVAPHPCLGCGKVGAILCHYCKYDIMHEPFLGCVVCQMPSPAGICEVHHSPIERAFVVGLRETALEAAINRYKFHNMRDALPTLIELLNARLPYLPDDTIVVSVPTVASHIRTRGYDHAGLLARQLAYSRSLPYRQPLQRVTTTTQHIVDKRTRLAQAQVAFALKPNVLLRGKTVLLVDDVITTGATVTAVAELLQSAGARVWVAALAYQPIA